MVWLVLGLGEIYFYPPRNLRLILGLDPILLKRKIDKSEQQLRPAIIQIARLPLASLIPLHRPRQPCKNLPFFPLVFLQQLRMRAPNNPHACPPTCLNPGYGILKNKTFLRRDFLLDALGANVRIDSLESYQIDIWRRFALALGDTRVVAEDAVLEWEVGENVG